MIDENFGAAEGWRDMEDVNEMDEAGSGHANPLTSQAFRPKTKVEEFCDAFPDKALEFSEE